MTNNHKNKKDTLKHGQRKTRTSHKQTNNQPHNHKHTHKQAKQPTYQNKHHTKTRLINTVKAIPVVIIHHQQVNVM